MVHRGHWIAAKKACPAPFAGDVSAVQDAGHWDVTPGLHQEGVRDCPWEVGRDCPSATVELARPVLPELQDALESRLARQPQDERPKAESRLVPLAVQAQQVAPLWAPLLAHADESELAQAQWLRARQVSPPEKPLLVQRLAPSSQPEQWPRALRARSALPLERLEPLARSVSPRLAQRSIVEAPRAQLASTAPPSLLLPSPLFLPWQPLPLALLLRRRPESFYAPFPQRPRGSSSSASSFP